LSADELDDIEDVTEKTKIEISPLPNPKASNNNILSDDDSKP
jgi:hypothetical protein